MTRTNLAVCFGPVIFNLNYEYNKKKLNKSYKNASSYSSTASTNEGGLTGGARLPSTTTTTNSLSSSLSVESGSGIGDMSKTATTIVRPNVTLEIIPPKDKERKLSEVGRPHVTTRLSEDAPPTPPPLCVVNNLSLTYPEDSLTMSADQEVASLDNNNNNSNENAQQSVPSSPLREKRSMSTASKAYAPPPSYQAYNSNNKASSQQHQPADSKSNYKNKFNKAASSLVNFGADKSSTLFSDSSKDNMDNLEYLSRAVQQWVSDMIKYSIELFTVSLT
jgi:hypothetical protein